MGTNSSSIGMAAVLMVDGEAHKRTVLPEHLISSALATVSAADAAGMGGLPAGAPSQRKFSLAVDTEDKAVQLKLLTLARPHMMAFHLSWISFFLTFMTTFAPAALLPVLQDALDLTAADISHAGIASVCGTIFSRMAMGSLTDMVGPRYSAAIALLGTAPFVFGMSLMKTAAAFIALRMLVGLNLSMFVVTQKWTSEMFNRQLVGRANALSAGWGNTGAGATLLLMPLLYDGFAQWIGPQLAWRAAFFVPGSLQVLLGLLILQLTDDTPAGRLPKPNKEWLRVRSSACHSWPAVLLNPRPYLLATAYAISFGVELTCANIVSLYLYNHFHLSLTTAGLLGGSFGLMNVCSRFLGGAGSDVAASHRGMRGRMWVLLVLLVLEGVFCLLVGITHDSLWATCAMLYLFSLFCQMACGAVFGVVPFLSHRFTGLAVGVVAAGGNMGSAVTQAVFFGNKDFTPYEGFYWMGACIICLGVLVCLGLYWPMWGGLCCGPRPGATEERYYLKEYSPSERAAGMHSSVLAFAHEARLERDPRPCPWYCNCSCCCGCCGSSGSGSSGSGRDAAAGQLHLPSRSNGSCVSSTNSRNALLPPGVQVVVAPSPGSEVASAGQPPLGNAVGLRLGAASLTALKGPGAAPPTVAR